MVTNFVYHICVSIFDKYFIGEKISASQQFWRWVKSGQFLPILTWLRDDLVVCKVVEHVVSGCILPDQDDCRSAKYTCIACILPYHDSCQSRAKCSSIQTIISGDHAWQHTECILIYFFTSFHSMISSINCNCTRSASYRQGATWFYPLVTFPTPFSSLSSPSPPDR